MGNRIDESDDLDIRRERIQSNEIRAFRIAMISMVAITAMICGTILACCVISWIPWTPDIVREAGNTLLVCALIVCGAIVLIIKG